MALDAVLQCSCAHTKVTVPDESKITGGRL